MRTQKVLAFVCILIMAWPAIAANEYMGRTVGGGAASYSQPSEDDVSTACPLNQVWKSNGSGGMGCAADLSGGGGTPNTLNLGNDGTTESTDLVGIATTGDTHGVFSMPSSDNLLIDLTKNWPTADEADALSSNITAIGGRTPW